MFKKETGPSNSYTFMASRHFSKYMRLQNLCILKLPQSIYISNGLLSLLVVLYQASTAAILTSFLF